MLPTEDLFGHVCVLIHDLMLSGAMSGHSRSGADGTRDRTASPARSGAVA
jgi:hypothetical protein